MYPYIQFKYKKAFTDRRQHFNSGDRVELHRKDGLSRDQILSLLMIEVKTETDLNLESSINSRIPNLEMLRTQGNLPEDSGKQLRV